MLVGALLVAQAKPQQSAELLESPGAAVIAERVPKQLQSDDVELAEPVDDADLANRDVDQTSDEAEPSDDAEQVSDDAEPEESTACVISAGVFVEPVQIRIVAEVGRSAEQRRGEDGEQGVDEHPRTLAPAYKTCVRVDAYKVAKLEPRRHARRPAATGPRRRAHPPPRASSHIEKCCIPPAH